MPLVTVAGAHGHTVTLDYDTNANTALARQIAAGITRANNDGTLVAAASRDGPPPGVPSGHEGEWVQNASGTTFLPSGYTAVVDSARNALIFGSDASDQSVMVGSGNLTFIDFSGSGTIAGGGGDNRLLLEQGNWKVTLGNGDNEVLDFGGQDTISAGHGLNYIDISRPSLVSGGLGNSTVTAGAATLMGGTNLEMINGSSGGEDTVQGFQHGQAVVDLVGYATDEASHAVATQTHFAGSTTVTLTDHTKITFLGLDHVTGTDFKTG